MWRLVRYLYFGVGQQMGPLILYNHHSGEIYDWRPVASTDILL